MVDSRGRLDVEDDLQVARGRIGLDVDASVEVTLVDTRMESLEHKFFAVHGGSAAVGGIHGGADPIEVSGDVAVDTRMDVSHLRREGDLFALGTRHGDGVSEVVGRRGAERGVDVGEMLAVELVEVSVVGGMVLGAVPPV